jgi:hypothetical protein
MNELRSVAEKLQYGANAKDYHQSVVASLTARGVVSRIVISFHSVGSGFRGLVVAVAYFQTGDGSAVPVSDDVFRISYEDAPADVGQRYAGWLDHSLMKGLAEWRRTLV